MTKIKALKPKPTQRRPSAPRSLKIDKSQRKTLYFVLKKIIKSFSFDTETFDFKSTFFDEPISGYDQQNIYSIYVTLKKEMEGDTDEN